MIRFHHGLEHFPEVRAAHQAGELSYTAALLLLPLLHETTEVLWVNWAARLTYREIERVTEFARLFALPGADPGVFASWADSLLAMGVAERREGPGANTLPPRQEGWCAQNQERWHLLPNAEEA